jgi:hypothetical protein
MVIAGRIDQTVSFQLCEYDLATIIPFFPPLYIQHSSLNNQSTAPVTTCDLAGTAQMVLPRFHNYVALMRRDKLGPHNRQCLSVFVLGLESYVLVFQAVVLPGKVRSARDRWQDRTTIYQGELAQSLI